MKHYDNTTIRRQDRLLSVESAQQLICVGEYGTLSLLEEREGEAAAYGVPLSYVWDEDETIYFHGALTGHKQTCIAYNPLASFCIVGKTQVIAEQFTTTFESVIIRGIVRVVDCEEEKRLAFKLLSKKYAPHLVEKGVNLGQKLFSKTLIFKLMITQISGKSKMQ